MKYPKEAKTEKASRTGYVLRENLKQKQFVYQNIYT